MRDTDTWREEDLFDAARKRMDPLERIAFLEDACAGNLEMRDRLAELLSAEAEAEQFFTESGSALRLPGDIRPFPAPRG
ncbi:MAG TPA: hypothetical protein VKC60_08085, partial [Opitutaceae bacterium]|nr:hypothetical protein [Opitutaceae bacterium]